MFCRKARQATQLFADLIRQFTGRAEYQRLGAKVAHGNTVEQPDTERRRFTAAGFCPGPYVRAAQYGRQRHRLDWRHCAVAQLGKVR